MSFEHVEFDSHGDTIKGDLYLPSGPGPHPVVVLAGGWCYVKELRQPQYAEEFAARGVAALVIDYRRLGVSEGEPRQHIIWTDQIEDYRNAITYLETRDDIDNDRIGAWGISYSGGHVLILAAIDPRVKAVVSTVPVIDGFENMWKVQGSERMRHMETLLLEDRRKRFATGEHGYIGMSATPRGIDDDFTVWPFDEIRSVFMELKESQAPTHEHHNTIASLENLMTYNAAPYAARIVNKPVMMVIAEADDITPWDTATRVFQSIPSVDKELVILPSTSHMTLYSDLSALAVAAQAAGHWFATHLGRDDKAKRLLSKFAPEDAGKA